MILDKHPDNSPKANGLKALGYWKNDHHPDFPDPRDYVDDSWNPIERKAAALYLKAGRTIASWRGWSSCRMCGKKNGSICQGDDKYVWPEGLAHYVEEHGVRPPDEFLKHIFGKMLSGDLPKEPEPPPEEPPKTPWFKRTR